MLTLKNLRSINYLFAHLFFMYANIIFYIYYCTARIAFFISVKAFLT